MFIYRRKFIFISALTALMIVGFMATSLTSYFVVQESLSRNVSEQMLPLTSDNIYSEIQRDLLRPILISSVMATDTFVRDWALEGEEDSARIISYLNEIQQQYNTITAFYVSDATRQYYHPSGVLKTVSEQDPADAWYFRVRGLQQDYEVNVDTDTADRS
ncbi:MAG: diguanylate cyclase, partial [Pseudohongiella sp.]|nr:diguanylate cyclase [Pseudohongiella sp.]